MATEYFSPSGTLISSSTVGIIDDPNFTVYVGTTGSDAGGDGTKTKPFKTPHKAMSYLRNQFITDAGFATIKCGAGTYTFDKPIEVRHPQGDRIGIRGEETKDYILAKCNGWDSSHSSNSLNGQIAGVDSLFGTTACRFYEAKAILQDLDWETTGNMLEPDDTSSDKGVGTVDGTSGDFVIVRDWTFAHEPGYDVPHNDWGMDITEVGTISDDACESGCASVFRNKNSSHRAPLCGAHRMVDSSRNGSDANGYVTYTCKYYNYPIYKLYELTQLGNQPVGTGKRLWLGGWRAPNADPNPMTIHDIEGTDSWEPASPSGGGYGDYYNNPFPPATTNNDTNTNPARFGDATEGYNSSDVSTSVLNGYTSFSDTGSHVNKMRGYQANPAPHIGLNRMILTHLKTVFEFTDITKPGIDIDGGNFGFIQDLALEGSWQQFSKHSVDTDQSLYDENAIGSNLTDNQHCGIDVHDSASLCYNLGKTGDTSAVANFSEHITGKMQSNDTTILNVAVNGFHSGVRVSNNSFANVNDIVVSNCKYGIFSTENSEIDAERSVVTGTETIGIYANAFSKIKAPRSIVAMVGVPLISVTFYNKDLGAGATQGFVANSFRPGDSIVLNNGADEPRVGIVMSWGSTDKPGMVRLNLYDYSWSAVRGTNISKGDIDTHGLKLEGGAAGSSSDATVEYDTHPSTGYLRCEAVWTPGKLWTSNYRSNCGSYMNANNSAAFDGYHGFQSSTNSKMYCQYSVIHSCDTAGYSTNESSINIVSSKALNCITAFKTDHRSRMNSSNCIIENCETGHRATVGSIAHSYGTHHIEGLSRMAKWVHDIDLGSMVKPGVGATRTFFETFNGDYGSNSGYSDYESQISTDSIEYT